MKKTYIKPSIKAYAAETTEILAGSVNNAVGNGIQLSNQMGSIFDDEEDDEE